MFVVALTLEIAVPVPAAALAIVFIIGGGVECAVNCGLPIRGVPLLELLPTTEQPLPNDDGVGCWSLLVACPEGNSIIYILKDPLEPEKKKGYFSLKIHVLKIVRDGAWKTTQK